MNGDAPRTRRQASWLLTWLGGTAVTLVLVQAALLVWMHAISGSAAPGDSDPTLITLYSVPYFAVAIGVTNFLAVAIMALAERRKPKPLAVWLVAGLIANAPAAFVAWGLSNMGDCFDRCVQTSALQDAAPALCFYAFGLLGTFAMYRFRHGNWHA